MAHARDQPGHLPRIAAGRGIDGPLFLGIDTHALSEPACATALEVLAANGVDVMLAEHDEYTPTPVVSHAILGYNRGRNDRARRRHRDHAVAQSAATTAASSTTRRTADRPTPTSRAWIEAQANELLERGLDGVKRMPYEKALRAATTHRHDYLDAYVRDLGNVVDMDAIRGAGLRLGVDPLGGAGVHYWAPIADRYRLDLTVVSDVGGSDVPVHDGGLGRQDPDGSRRRPTRCSD